MNSNMGWSSRSPGHEIVYIGDAAGAAAYIGEGPEQFDLEGIIRRASGLENILTNFWQSRETGRKTKMKIFFRVFS